MTHTHTILYSVDFNEDTGDLDREATIMVASSEEEAKQKLADFFDQCCTPSHLVVSYGWATLSREWKKLAYAPSPEDLADICNEEFDGEVSPDDLTVSAPGTHPGRFSATRRGNRWWISCRLPVLVITRSVEIPDPDVPDTPTDCENWEDVDRFVEAGGAWVNSSSYGEWGLYTDEEVANWPPCDGIPSSVMAELVRRSGRWFSADQLRRAKAQQISEIMLVRKFSRDEFSAWVAAWDEGEGTLEGFMSRRSGNWMGLEDFTPDQWEIDALDGASDYYTDFGWNVTDFPAGREFIEVTIWGPNYNHAPHVDLEGK